MSERLRDYYDAKALELDELAATYEHPEPYKRFFYEARFDAVLHALDARPGERVLDVGCGIGWYARALAQRGAEVTATDVAPNYVEQARLLVPGAQFAVEDAQALSFDDESFDKVLMTEVVEHVPDPGGALREAARVLRSDGVAVVTTPSRFSPLNVAYSVKRRVRRFSFNEHLHEFTPRSFRRALERHFRVESLAFANFLLPYPLDGLYLRLGSPGVSALPRLERALARTPVVRRLGWTMVARARKA